MTDRRTTHRLKRLAAGQCARCGADDAGGELCRRCQDRVNAQNRQRYRPGMQAAEWTMAFLARYTAIEMRGWV